MSEDGIGNPLKFVFREGEQLVGSIQNSLTPDKPEQGANKRRAQKNYQYNYITYPSTLGEETRHPYYITFYVNLQNLSKFKVNSKGQSNLALDRGQSIHSTVAIHQQGRQGLQKNFSLGKDKSKAIGFGAKTSRTKTAIRLYMPDTLSWSYQNKFSDVSLSGTPLGKAAAIVGGGISLVEEVQKGGVVSGLSNLVRKNETRGLAGEFIGGALLGDAGLGLKSVGLALNPQIDIIYQSPELRTFNFEFMFAPRTSDEGRAVQEIIKTFKFHSAPELLSDGGIFGRYFVPPSDFDIEFSLNTMGKISTCVLQNVTVDYGPTGAAFYKDGTPVHTRLTLQFMELEYITKELIQDEGY